MEDSNENRINWRFLRQIKKGKCISFNTSAILEECVKIRLWQVKFILQVWKLSIYKKGLHFVYAIQFTDNLRWMGKRGGWEKQEQFAFVRKLEFQRDYQFEHKIRGLECYTPCSRTANNSNLSCSQTVRTNFITQACNTCVTVTPKYLNEFVILNGQCEYESTWAALLIGNSYCF